MFGQVYNKIRGKRLNKHFCFGGGYPKFRLIPSFTKWGNNISLFWLGVELVYLGNKKRA
jgi:hypothetical protein